MRIYEIKSNFNFCLVQGNILQRGASSCQQTKRDPLSEDSGECDWIRFPRIIKMARVQESWGLKREAFASLVDSLDANESCRRFGKSWNRDNVQKPKHTITVTYIDPHLWRGSHPIRIYPIVVHSNWEGSWWITMKGGGWARNSIWFQYTPHSCTYIQ